MRTRYLLGAIALIFLTSCGNSHINKFYRKHRKGIDSQKYVVPGWMIWTASGIVNESTKDPNLKMLMRIAKKVKRAKIVRMDKNRQIPKGEVNELVKKLRADKFDDLFYIRDGSTTASMMIRERKNKIKNVFLMVDEEDEFILLHLKTRLKPEEIKKLLRTYRKEMESDKKIQERVPIHLIRA